MTKLENTIFVAAPREKVWAALRSLDMLQQYDPGVLRSTVLDGKTSGIGARRQCDLRPGGWFREAVTEQDEERLTFELYECTLPVKRLRHSYRLQTTAGGVQVTQVMAYELKYGFLGAALDLLFVRRKWNAGIKAFLLGLKEHVETR